MSDFAEFSVLLSCGDVTLHVTTLVKLARNVSVENSTAVVKV